MKKVTKIAEAANTKVKLKKIRVAAYCRVSTDSDAQLESLEAQKTHYETYITSRDDWEFAGLYYDEGITGTKKDKRPELMRLIGDCKAGRIEISLPKWIQSHKSETTLKPLEIKHFTAFAPLSAALGEGRFSVLCG